MVCKKCGAEMQEKSGICPECGIINFHGKTYTREEILSIIDRKSMVVYAWLSTLLAVVFVRMLPGMFTSLIFFASVLFFCISFCRLCSAEKENIFVTIILMILIMVPILRLLFIIILEVNGSRIVKASGLKVGLSGLTQKEIDEFLRKEQ